LNWLLFIWAVNIGRVLETSLGYFMTPLVNVLLGAVILRERLSAWQIASILLATRCRLDSQAFGYGHFPWIAVGLCTSFGLYGLLRKQSAHRCDSRPVFRNDLSATACALFISSFLAHSGSGSPLGLPISIFPRF
jgi:chloramphenicol-sensitive protein RarD